MEASCKGTRYGINTGFGKLASARIEPATCAAADQHRSVAVPQAWANGTGQYRSLMLALKLASPRTQGESGVRPATLARWRQAAKVDPVVPSQGSVGAGGRSCAACAYAAAMIVSARSTRRRAQTRCRSSQQRRAEPLALGPKRGWRCSTVRSSPTPMHSRRCSTSAICCARQLINGVLSTRLPRGPMHPSYENPALRRHRGQIDCADALRRLMAAAPSGRRNSSATTACRTLMLALPAR